MCTVMSRSNNKMSTGIYISHIHHMCCHIEVMYISKHLLPLPWPRPLNDLSHVFFKKLDFEVHSFMFAGKLFQSFIAEYTKLLLLHFDLLGIIEFLLVALLVLPWLKVKFWLRYFGARSFAILKTWFNLSWDTLSGTFNILTLSKISCVMEVLGSMFNIKRTTLFWHIWSFFNIREVEQTVLVRVRVRVE